MLNEQSEIFGKLIVTTLLMALFADIVLRSVWNKMYFTIGVPIFLMRIPVKTQYKGVPFQHLFEDEFQDTWAASFVFKPMDAHSYAFREKLFHPRLYIPLMHGLIVFENEKSQVVVKGLANWLTLWLILYFLLSWLNLLGGARIHITGPLSLIVVLVVIMYVIQYLIFSKVGRFAAELCSKKHFLNNGEV